MISSASVLLLAGAALGADSLPSALVARVQEWIGQQWSVPAPSVQLDWGRHGTLTDAMAGAPIRVSGSGQNGWFVVTIDPAGDRPAAITVRAGTTQSQVVAARALAVGTRLAEADVLLAERVTWGPPVPPDADAFAVGQGWEVRRAVAEGATLAPPVVMAPRMVVSGDPVVFVWSRGAVRMERTAIAQGSARLGERVHAQVGAVRLSGIVTGPRTAHVEQEGTP
jgi:flagella basal body P-ring formation protein FlgA